MQKLTCGPLYKMGLERFTGLDPDKIPIFAAGFVSGEAEKVYLGACRAAMFRPSSEWKETLLAIVEDVAERYGLVIEMLKTSRGPEIWLCKDQDAVGTVRLISGLEENSPEWHIMRGHMCGVPHYHLDIEFHKRSGYGENCDR